MFIKGTIFLAVVVILVSGEVEDPHKIETPVDREKRHHDHGHSADVDHEAFLGRDHAHDFDDYDEEESKARLAELLPQVDKDDDGNIDQDELKDWIKLQVMDYVKRDAEQAFPTEDTNNDGKITWEEYVINTFGEKYLKKPDEKPAEGAEEKKGEEAKDGEKKEDDDDYSKFVKRDKARFDLADVDKDGALSLDEFTGFLHPEEYQHMSDVVVGETMDDMDEDNDGKISLAEYIGELGEHEDDDDDEWIEKEKENFQKVKDKNGDGYLDKAEVHQWIVPAEVNYSLEEAKHLIEKADENDDGVLSYQEIVENHDVFVGSQATDYGRMLHEEL